MDATEYLLTSSEETQQFSVCLWDYRTSNSLKCYRNGGVVQRKCLGLLGKDYLLSAQPEKPLLQVWLLNGHEVSRDVRLILPEPASCMTICPENVYLAVGIRSKLYIWHLPTGKLLAVQHNSFRTLTCMKFSSDGMILVVGGEDGMLYTYDFGVLVDTSNSCSQSNVIEPIYMKHDHIEEITDIHIGTFNGKARFATVSTDQSCRVYSLEKGIQLLNLVFMEKLTSVVFDSPCWQLFVGTESGRIYQYNLTNPPGSLTHHFTENSGIVFEKHRKRIVCMALNQANTVLASGSEDNFVCLWDLRSRKCLKEMDHKAPITNVMFVGACKNFFAEKFRPQSHLKCLGRSVDDSPLWSYTMDSENEETDSDDNGKSSGGGKVVKGLLSENRRLRAVNTHMYNTCLTIVKKYTSNKADT